MGATPVFGSGAQEPKIRTENWGQVVMRPQCPFRQEGVHRVRNRPPPHVPRVPPPTAIVASSMAKPICGSGAWRRIIHHRTEIGMPMRHRNVRDIRTPRFIGPLHGAIPQEIRIFSMSVVGVTCPARAVPNCLDPHFSPESLIP